MAGALSGHVMMTFTLETLTDCTCEVLVLYNDVIDDVTTAYTAAYIH